MVLSFMGGSVLTYPPSPLSKWKEGAEGWKIGLNSQMKVSIMQE